MNLFEDLIPWVQALIPHSKLIALSRSLLILLCGIIVFKILRKVVGKALQGRAEVKTVLIIQKAITYFISIIVLAYILHEFGFSLSILVGTAGFLTVALGFASQTSVSNIISGLFLMGEKPFDIGSVVEVDGICGEVLSVDLLSVKIRTFDNKFVRIPNELMLKTKVTNLNRFPIRRLDMPIGIAYKEDLESVKKILDEVADSNPLCLNEPKPLFIFLGYGDSSLNIQFSIWSSRENYLELRNSMYLSVKKAFDTHAIEIPFPQRVVTHPRDAENR